MDKEANEKSGKMKAGAHLQEFVANNKNTDAKESESRPAKEAKGSKKKGAPKKKAAPKKKTAKSKKDDDDEEAVFL